MENKYFDAIIDTVKEDIKEDQALESIYNSLRPLVEKHNGKAFGKLFEKELKAMYPNAFIENKYSLKYIHIPKEYLLFLGLKEYHADSMTINVGSLSGGGVSLDTFDRQTCFQEKQHERIKKNKAFLKNKKLIQKFADALQKIDEASQVFKDRGNLSYKIPSLYGILRLTEYKLEENKKE